MGKSKGYIVYIKSKTAGADQGRTLSREWTADVLHYGVRLNAGCQTIFYEKWPKTSPTGSKKEKTRESKIPLGNRMTTSEEIANMAVFLLSEQSSHNAGQLIYVDSGDVHLDRRLSGINHFE